MTDYRSQVPFILLELDREQDAYNYIKWWATIYPKYPQDPNNVPSEGDWIYLTGQDIFEDIFSLEPDYQESSDLSLMVALFLIKSKILEKWDSWKFACESFEAFEEAVYESGALGQKLCRTDLAMDRIKDFVFWNSLQVNLKKIPYIIIN